MFENLERGKRNILCSNCLDTQFPSQYAHSTKKRVPIKPSDYKGKDISFFIIGGYQHGKEA
jgi:hypothetical protein